MRYFLTITTILLLTVSCYHPAESTPTPEQIAKAFLTAYYQPDFDQIIHLCASGSTLKSDMERNAQTYHGYPPETQKKLSIDLAAYSFRIEQVDLNRTKDSAFVSYSIFTPEFVNGKACRLTLIKEEHDWKVARLL